MLRPGRLGRLPLATGEESAFLRHLAPLRCRVFVFMARIVSTASLGRVDCKGNIMKGPGLQFNPDLPRGRPPGDSGAASPALHHLEGAHPDLVLARLLDGPRLRLGEAV